MFAQLLLTIKKTYDKGDLLPPKFLGVFDNQKIVFVEFHHVLPIFNVNDFNWSERPSTVSDKTVQVVKKFLDTTALIGFSFKENENELKEFIKNNFVIGSTDAVRIQITKNNFISVFMKWLATVRPTIDINSEEAKEDHLIDGDFYLGDLLSEDNVTLPQFQNLPVVLHNDHYRIKVKVEGKRKRLINEIFFRDNGKAHKDFWTKYQRPPKEEFHGYMQDRHDLLVPQEVRERKGSFYTPQIWVEKSQEYLAKVFGENWQDEYYVWDCCCGTGNLLTGLVNPYRVWASTIDQSDIDIIHTSISNGRNNLLESHVFQFDFLNGNFDDLPEGLRNVINDPEKRKKLIVYMNPPYAEAMNKRDTKKAKTDVNRSRIEKNYSNTI
jgi:hypothetical protein